MTDATSNAVSAITEETTVAAPARKEAAGVMKRSSSFSIDPRMITRREGFNPRFDFGDIEGLAVSIKANGLLNAIRVKRLSKPADGKVFELIDGDRRLTAIELLLKKGEAFPDGIPAIIVDKAQEDITSLIQMFEANSGKVFLPLEEAAAYKRMRDAKMTIKEICAAVGRKHMHVTEILALVDADQSLKDAVADGSVGKTMAKNIAKHAKGDVEKQKELVADLKAAGKDGKKRRAVIAKVDDARRAKSAKKGKTLKIRALSDAELSDLGSTIAALLQKKLMEAKAMMHASNMEKWISADDKLVAACTFGMLQGLKMAAGVKIKADL